MSRHTHQAWSHFRALGSGTSPIHPTGIMMEAVRLGQAQGWDQSMGILTAGLILQASWHCSPSLLSRNSPAPSFTHCHLHAPLMHFTVWVAICWVLRISLTLCLSSLVSPSLLCPCNPCILFQFIWKTGLGEKLPKLSHAMAWKRPPTSHVLMDFGGQPVEP